MEQLPVLDTAVLDELREVMGSDFPILIASFVRDGRQRIDALRRALSAGDGEQARQQAHSFKGSSGNLGALRVTGLCLDIEQYAGHDDLAAAAALMDTLEQTFEQACNRLNQLDDN